MNGTGPLFGWELESHHQSEIFSRGLTSSHDPLVGVCGVGRRGVVICYD
jgi:hypothetical protein